MVSAALPADIGNNKIEGKSDETYFIEWKTEEELEDSQTRVIYLAAGYTFFASDNSIRHVRTHCCSEA